MGGTGVGWGSVKKQVLKWYMGNPGFSFAVPKLSLPLAGTLSFTEGACPYSHFPGSFHLKSTGRSDKNENFSSAHSLSMQVYWSDWWVAPLGDGTKPLKSLRPPGPKWP